MDNDRCKDCTPAILYVGLRKDIDEHSETLKDDLKGIYVRLNIIEADNSSLKTDLKNLCEQIKGLVTTLRWTVGIVLTAVGMLIAVLKI